MIPRLYLTLFFIQVYAFLLTAQSDTLRVTLQTETKCREQQGLIQSTVTGGLLPYRYRWNTGDTTAFLSYSKKGIYTLVIADAAGREGTASVATEDVAALPLLLEKKISDNGSLHLSHVISTRDGGMLVAVQNSNDGNQKSVLYKMDVSGEVEWQSVFPSRYTAPARAIAQSADGGFWMFGESNATDPDLPHAFQNRGNVWQLARLDSKGHLLWKKWYKGNFSETANAVRVLPDGSVLLGGGTLTDDAQPSSGYTYARIWVMRVDEQGTTIWDKRLGGPRDAYLTNIVSAANGETVIVFNTTGQQEDVRIVYCAVEDGSIRHETTFGGNGIDFAVFADALSDGRMVIGGRSGSTDIPGFFNRPQAGDFLLILSPDGSTDTLLNYGNMQTGNLTGFLERTDSEYFIATKEYNPTALWLLRTNAKGTLLQRARSDLSLYSTPGITSILPAPDSAVWLVTNIFEQIEGKYHGSIVLQKAGYMVQNAPLLPKDTLVCPGAALSIPLPAGVGTPQTPAQWEDGSPALADRRVTVGASDTVFTLTAAQGGCSVGDTWRIRTHKMKAQALVRFSSVCGADNGAATVLPSRPAGRPRIRWSDGDTSFTRNNFAVGIHTFAVSDDVCTQSGEIVIGRDTLSTPRPNGSRQLNSSMTMGSVTYPLPIHGFQFLRGGDQVFSSTHYSHNTAFIRKMNASGGFLDFYDGNQNVFRQIDTFANGDFLTAAISLTENKIEFLRLNKNLEIKKRQKFPDIYGGDYYKFRMAPDGGFYTLSKVASANHLRVDKWREDMSLAWSRLYGGSGNDMPVDMLVSSAGRVLLLASSDSPDWMPGAQKGGLDVWLLLINSSGDALWSKSWGGSRDDVAHSLVPTSDGAIVVSQTLSTDGDLPASTSPGFWRVWTMKTDWQGNLQWSDVEETTTLYDRIQGTQAKVVQYTAPAPGGGAAVVTSDTRILNVDGKTRWRLPVASQIFYDGFYTFYTYRFNTGIVRNQPGMPLISAGDIWLDRHTMPVPPPPVSLGPDTFLCYDRHSIRLGQELPEGFFYQWINNSYPFSTQRTLEAGYPARFQVAVGSAPGCVSRDTVLVDFCLQSALRDTANCVPIVLRHPGSLFPRWQNGTYADTANQSGNYIVQLTNLRGQSIFDTVQVSIYGIGLTGYVDQTVKSIVTKVHGGQMPFSYKWQDGVLTPNRNDLSGGLYSVTVTDRNGCTATAEFRVSYLVSNQTPEDVFDMKVFPNPVAARLTLEIPVSADPAHLLLQHVTGQTQLLAPLESAVSGNSRFLTFDVAALPPGMYVVKCKKNNIKILKM